MHSLSSEGSDPQNFTSNEARPFPFQDIPQAEQSAPRAPGYYLNNSQWPEEVSAANISARDLRKVVAQFSTVFDWAMADLAECDAPEG